MKRTETQFEALLKKNKWANYYHISALLFTFFLQYFELQGVSLSRPCVLVHGPDLAKRGVDFQILIDTELGFTHDDGRSIVGYGDRYGHQVKHGRSPRVHGFDHQMVFIPHWRFIQLLRHVNTACNMGDS